MLLDRDVKEIVAAIPFYDRIKIRPLPTESYYLNNDGSRWTYDPPCQVIVVKPDGTVSVRNVAAYEAFGNFATAVVRYKHPQQGKERTYKCLPQDRDPISLLPIVQITDWDDYVKDKRGHS